MATLGLGEMCSVSTPQRKDTFIPSVIGTLGLNLTAVDRRTNSKRFAEMLEGSRAELRGQKYFFFFCPWASGWLKYGRHMKYFREV